MPISSRSPLAVWLCLLLALMSATMDLHAGPPTSMVTLRPTHAGLLKQRKSGPVVTLTNAKRLNPENRARTGLPAGLLASSTVLAHAGAWTIVPKHAVLFVPARHLDRVGVPPGGTLLPWRQFYLKNREWIHTQEVTMSDARGETVLSQATRDTHKTLEQIVVAVLQGGPISVLPPRSPSH